MIKAKLQAETDSQIVLQQGATDPKQIPKSSNSSCESCQKLGNTFEFLLSKKAEIERRMETSNKLHDKFCSSSLIDTRLRVKFERYTKWASEDSYRKMEQLGQSLSQEVKGTLAYARATMKKPQDIHHAAPQTKLHSKSTHPNPNLQLTTQNQKHFYGFRCQHHY